METLEEIAIIRKLERSINENLFRICVFITILILILYSIEFLSGGKYPSPNIEILYLGTLILYSFHKELLRWLGEKEIERRGEFFVYVWIGFALFFHLINFFTNNYFIKVSGGKSLVALNEITTTTLEVLAVFLLTRTSKIIEIRQRLKKEKQ